MKHLSLKAELRTEFGKKAAKAARREGMVPCNLYGAGENVTFVVNEKELRALIYTPSSFIVELDFNGKIEKALTVKVAAFSESAKAKIEAAGGKAEVI